MNASYVSPAAAKRMVNAHHAQNCADGPATMMHMHHVPSTPSELPCACTTLRKAARAVGRLYDSALAGTGLTANQLAILRSLARTGPQPLSRLAEAMVMDRTSLYRALSPLERADQVSIEAAGTGRARVARLTPEGRRVMEAAAASWESVQGRLVGDFGPSAWSAMAESLRDIIALASPSTTSPESAETTR